MDEVVFPGKRGLTPVVGADLYLNESAHPLLRRSAAHRRDNGAVRLRLEVENAIAPLLPHGKARGQKSPAASGSAIARWRGGWPTKA